MGIKLRYGTDRDTEGLSTPPSPIMDFVQRSYVKTGTNVVDPNPHGFGW